MRTLTDGTDELIMYMVLQSDYSLQGAVRTMLVSEYLLTTMTTLNRNDYIATVASTMACSDEL